MTTPQQNQSSMPAEETEDLELPADAQENVAGGDGTNVVQETVKNSISNIR